MLQGFDAPEKDDAPGGDGLVRARQPKVLEVRQLGQLPEPFVAELVAVTEVERLERPRPCERFQSKIGESGAVADVNSLDRGELRQVGQASVRERVIKSTERFEPFQPGQMGQTGVRGAGSCRNPGSRAW